MKRSLIVLCAAALLATLPLARVSVAAKPDKEANVEICHVNSANDVLVLKGFTLFFGRVMEVPASAVAAHLAHGDFRTDSTFFRDSTFFFYMDEEDRDGFELAFGINLRNANAFYYIED